MYDFQLEAYTIKAENSAKLGHNPSLSAKKNLQGIKFQPCRFFLCPKKCTKNAPHPIFMHLFGCFLPHKLLSFSNIYNKV